MVTTRIKWTATSATAPREKKCKAKTSKQNDLEEVGWDGRLPIGGGNCQRRSCSCSSLRPDQCLRLIWNAGEHLVAKFAFHSRICFLLPASSGGSWLRVFRLSGLWTGATCQSVPRWRMELHSVSRMDSALRRRFQEWGHCFSVTLCDQHLCHLGLTLPNHRHAVGPIGPMGWRASSDCSPQPKTSPSEWH